LQRQQQEHCLMVVGLQPGWEQVYLLLLLRPECPVACPVSQMHPLLVASLWQVLA
jgi:hypothetical protein